MDRNQHTQRMRETSELVIPLIIAAYQRVIDEEPNLAEPLARFVERRTRLHQPLMRPYLVRLAYEISGGKEWERIAHACAASEIYNISTYQANLAIDRKLGVEQPLERAEQFSCAMISLEIAHKEIRSVKTTPGGVERILNDLQTINSKLYCGQLADMHMLSLGNLQDDTDYKNIYALYERRCQQLGGYFSAWCLTTGGILADASQSDIDRLAQIGMLTGTAGQMVNDVGDIVPVPEQPASLQSERYQSCYSDLLNGKATMAVLYGYECQDELVHSLSLKIWREQILDASLQFELTQRLLEIGAFAAVRKEVETYEKDAQRLIRQFPASQARDYFLLSTTTISHNKYFTYLRHLLREKSHETKAYAKVAK